MSSLFIDTRELRSFRIKYRIKEFQSLIEDKKFTIAFCTTNTLYPAERENLRSSLNSSKLKVIFFSKNTIKVLLKKKKWIPIFNLLEGDLYLVKHVQKNSSLTKPNILSIISLTNFTLRLFLSSQQFYRKDVLIKLLENLKSFNSNINPKTLIYFLLKKKVLDFNLFFSFIWNTTKVNLK